MGNGDMEFSTLLGLTLAAVEGMAVGSERITLRTTDGRAFTLSHYQDCYESVRVEDVTGDPAVLVGSPLTMAEVVTSNDGDPKPGEHAESWTWTFYKLATVKGYVTLRWLGESNGYYSEGFTFEEVPHVG